MYLSTFFFGEGVSIFYFLQHELSAVKLKQTEEET